MKKILLLSILIFLLVACEKDAADIKKVAKKDIPALLTAKPWFLADEWTTDLNNNIQHSFTSYGACQLDDEHVFKTDSSFEERLTGLKCLPNDPDIGLNGKWSIITNDTLQLRFGYGNFTVENWKVDFIDENSLTLIFYKKYYLPGDAYPYAAYGSTRKYKH